LNSHPGTGKLIVFEGIDGSGKTKHLMRTVKWLQQQGYQVLALCEPTYGPPGLKLRNSAQEGRLSAEEELNLFLEDRRWNVEKNILPALQSGKIVLLDRFYYSSIAYQGARGLDPEEIRRRNEAFAPTPDRVLLFDVESEIAVERIQQKRGDSPNLFEKLDYLRRVRDIFLSLTDPYIIRIDSSGPVEDVWQQVEAAIRPILDPNLS
jgi:dTMP kinase